MSERSFEILVSEDPEGRFIAQCAGMPGLTAEGATASEAESALMELLDARMQELGPALAGEAVGGDADEVHGDLDETE